MTLRDVTNRLFAQGMLTRLAGPTAVAVGSMLALPAIPAPPSAYLSQPAPASEQKPAPAELPALDEKSAPLSADAAIRYALLNNPEIAALRQQHGIAAAGVVIANTYPFNPVWESSVRAAFGPESSGVTNSVPITQRIGIDVELFHQGRVRREAAAATLSRTDWEIATQEVALSVRVLRAFDTVVYRFRKRQLLDDTLKYNIGAKDMVDRLSKDPAKGITAADAIFINTEVLKARAQLVPGQTALVTAWQEFYRALGVTSGTFDLSGGLETPPRLEDDADTLLQIALERRPDLRSHEVAVSEADARVRLEIKNRWGNPNIGPAYELNETRTNFIGLQFSVPLPTLNTHRGDIQQRQAERTRAALELRQIEVAVRQDVRASLARVEQARKWVDYYHREVIPTLEQALKDIQTLFEARQPGADLLKLIDVQRKLLDARDTELDAVFELRQALADLAAAVGDPSVAVLPSPKP